MGKATMPITPDYGPLIRRAFRDDNQLRSGAEIMAEGDRAAARSTLRAGLILAALYLIAFIIFA